MPSVRAQPEGGHHAKDAVVITGAGLVCALGLNKQDVWQAVAAGACGIRSLTAIEQPHRCDKGGGEAPALPGGFHDDLPREARYLRWALREALAESGCFAKNPPPPDRCGIVLGTTLGGMRAAGEYLRSGDLEHLSRFTAARTLQLALGDLRISGFSATTCSACASGLSSVVIAMTLLRAGEHDLVIAGGYDPISEYAYAGFNSLRLISDGALTPFARHRGGMKLGEGYGVLVLERAANARERGAVPLAQVLGFGESSDAHHLTQPHPDGCGAARAMLAAMADAGLEPHDVDMIAAHATGTPNNDAAEYQAYRNVFGAQLPGMPIVAFKSHVGHTLGGAGAVELILSMLALQHQVVPPTANTTPQNIEFEELRLLSRAEPHELQHTINLSMGFGGANACVVLGRAQSASPRIHALPAHHRFKREVFVTGVGVVLPGCGGNDAFVARLSGPDTSFQDFVGPVDDSILAALIDARRVRRMSTFAKLALAAATVAIRDAGITDPDEFFADCGAILSSAHGAVDFSEKYYRQVVMEGIDAANPLLFAEGVPNVASAQLSLMLNLKGGSQTFVGCRNAGLNAMQIAALRIGSGVWNRAIIGAADEFHPLVAQAYSKCGFFRSTSAAGPMASGAGAVAIILESRAAAERRGARSRGIISGSAGSEAGLPIAEAFSVNPLAAFAARLLACKTADGDQQLGLISKSGTKAV